MKNVNRFYKTVNSMSVEKSLSITSIILALIILIQTLYTCSPTLFKQKDKVKEQIQETMYRLDIGTNVPTFCEGCQLKLQ